MSSSEQQQKDNHLSPFLICFKQYNRPIIELKQKLQSPMGAQLNVSYRLLSAYYMPELNRICGGPPQNILIPQQS